MNRQTLKAILVIFIVSMLSGCSKKSDSAKSSYNGHYSGVRILHEHNAEKTTDLFKKILRNDPSGKLIDDILSTRGRDGHKHEVKKMIKGLSEVADGKRKLASSPAGYLSKDEVAKLTSVVSHYRDSTFAQDFVKTFLADRSLVKVCDEADFGKATTAILNEIGCNKKQKS